MKRYDQLSPISHRRMQSYVHRPVEYAGARGGTNSQSVVAHEAMGHTGDEPRKWSTFVQTVKATQETALRLNRTLQYYWQRRDWKVLSGTAVTIAVLVVSMLTPLFSAWQQQDNYDLSAAKSLLTATPDYLQKKLSYDAQSNAWMFNQSKNQSLPTESDDAVSVGDIKYNAQLPADLSGTKGLTLTDTNSKLDITLKPQFAVSPGQAQDGHIVYPLAGTQSQLVYSFKHNGVKEDIILYHAPGHTAEYSYALQLPAGMEARVQKDGSVGVFGGDPTLFGNISYGGDKDRTLVEKARENSAKNHLYYEIPAPVINGKNVSSVKAAFVVDGNSLTVKVSGLADASYPLSIDPSFVMDTSGCAWQGKGNNEANINFSGCQISRSLLSGGAVGSWTSGAAYTQPTQSQSMVAYNGYLYMIGGDTSGSETTSVQFAAINSSTGSVGTWNYTHNSTNDGATFVSGFTQQRQAFGALAYNGYLYVIGGQSGGGTVFKDVQYAPLNANGTVGAWTADTNSDMTVTRWAFGLQAYQGMMYAIGGCSSLFSGVCNSPINTIEKVVINGDGSLGTWSTVGNGSMTTNRFDLTTAVYNGFLYAVGGCLSINLGNCTNYLASTEYAPINADGTVGAWQTSTNIINGRRYASGGVYNGYLYVYGGTTSGSGFNNDTQLAKIYANGSLGPWQVTTSFTTARRQQAGVAYNGYLYVAGGCTNGNVSCNSGVLNDVQYAQISTALGRTGPYTAPASYSSTPVYSPAYVAYGGYIYMIGGTSVSSGVASGQIGTVLYAPINANGSIGTWTTSSTSMKQVQTGAGGFCATAGNCPGRVNVAAAVYNGYLYIAGGSSNGSGTTWSDIQSAPLDPTTGAPGTWTVKLADFITNNATTYNNADGRTMMGMQIYNGFMYLLGGALLGTPNTNYSTIYYAPLTTNGGVGTVATTTSLPQVRLNARTFVANNRLYVVGGGSGGVNDTDDVIFTTINGDGTLGSTWTDANSTLNGGSGTSFYTTTTGGYSMNYINGYVYIIGGTTGTGAAASQSTVVAAKVNADGSMGSWSTLQSFTTARYSHGSVAVNGFLYIMGGCSTKSALFTVDCNADANLLTDYQYAQIYNGGGGAPTGWTQSANTMITARLRHQVVVANGYMYAISGCSAWQTFPTVGCTALTSSVNYAKINTATGDVGAWASTTATVTAREYFAAVTYDGYIYVIGGCTAINCTSTTKAIQYAKPDAATGNITSWNTNPTGLPTGWTDGNYVRAVSAGNNLYVFNTTSSAYTTIDATTHQVNGDSGWTAGPSQITTYNDGTLEVVTNGKYIYELGGIKSGSGTSNIVVYVAINSNGSLGNSWNYTRFTDPGRHDNFVAAIYGGYLYIASGYNSLSTYDTGKDSQYASINDDGSLGKWVVGPKLQQSRVCTGGVAYNGYLYTVGGLVGSTKQDTFEWTALQTTPRKAQYSVLLSTDKDTNPANIFVTNSQQSKASNISLGYSGATQSSAVFGSTTTQDGVVSATKYPMTISSDGIAYYWLTITLDDNVSATYGETAGSNVSYLKLNYHPNPSMRLRGGKTFNNNILQSLDAP